MGVSACVAGLVRICGRMLALALLWPITATANDKPVVVMEVSACLTSPAGRDLVRALQVEGSSLQATVVFPHLDEQQSAPEVGDLRVRFVACNLGWGRIIVEAEATSDRLGPFLCADDGAEGAPSDDATLKCHQLMEFGDVPRVARPRTAAVAVNEWTRSLLHVAPAPPAQGRQMPAVEPARQKQRESKPAPVGRQARAPDRNSYEAKLVVHAAMHAAEETSLFGVSASMTVQLARRLAMEAEARYAHSGRGTPLGRAAVNWYGGAVGPDFLLDLEPDLRLGARFGVAEVTGAGASRLGIEEDSQLSYVAVLLLRAQLRVDLAPPWSLATALDVGTYAHGVVFNAGAEPVLAYTGPFGETRVGLGYSF